MEVSDLLFQWVTVFAPKTPSDWSFISNDFVRLRGCRYVYVILSIKEPLYGGNFKNPVFTFCESLYFSKAHLVLTQCDFQQFDGQNIKFFIVDIRQYDVCYCRHFVSSIKCTVHPNFPTRAVAICKDSTVRIITPYSGEVITTLLLDPQEHHVVDVTYSIADGEWWWQSVN